MLYVITSFEAAHGKGKEAVEFAKRVSDNFNSDSRPFVLESAPLMSRIGNNSTLMVMNKIESYAAWAKGVTESSEKPDDRWGMVGGWGSDFIVPGSVVRQIYEVIE
jgi:hypothetical protein